LNAGTNITEMLDEMLPVIPAAYCLYSRHHWLILLSHAELHDILILLSHEG